MNEPDFSPALIAAIIMIVHPTGSTVQTFAINNG